MDTKWKNTNGVNKGLCAAGSLLFVAGTVAALIMGTYLILAYDLIAPWWVEETAGVLTVKNQISEIWIYEVAAIIVALLGLALAIWKTGRTLTRFDRIFTEVQLGVGIAAGIGDFALLIVTTEERIFAKSWYDELVGGLTAEQQQIHNEMFYFRDLGFEPRWLGIFLCAGGMALLALLCLGMILSLVKKLKAHCFWKWTIAGIVGSYLYNKAKGSEDVFWKVMGVSVGACILSATWIGLIPVLVLLCIFMPKWIRKYTAVREGVAQVRAGNLDYKIPVDDDGELDRLAASINEISAATAVAVQNELKNQRLKTDLISNVSHDLKTPLTSMISYVDLLKTEGLDSDNAEDYLQIIDEKTRRLQQLTEDLFDAAKASSGAMPVNMERLELTAAVRQALAEMEGRLSAGNLEVILNDSPGETFVMADGQLLWRVMENLLVNVSKYALPGSRVYMDICPQGEDMLRLDVKNISRDQLNISAEELMERFTRGDASRNTEGSGLGLSIARDLTRLMDGRFALTIDGDLFKASVILRRAD